MEFSEFKGEFIYIKKLTENVKLFRIKLNKEINYKAGQFMKFEIVDEKNNKKYSRAYSIASCPKEEKKKEIEFCVKKINNGSGTSLLFKKKVGDIISLKGPFGIFTLDKLISKIKEKEKTEQYEESKKIVLIGTGTGVSPIRAILQDLFRNQEKLIAEITLILGFRNQKDSLFKAEFLAVERSNPNFLFREVISRPEEDYKGRRGHVQDNFDGIDTQNSYFFICGSRPMVEDVKLKLENLGVSKENIYFEKY